MSKSVTKVEIYRSIDNGVWKRLKIRFKNLNRRYSETEKWNLTNGDEKFAVSVLLLAILPRYSKRLVNANLDRLRYDIVGGFSQFREKHLDGNNHEYTKIYVMPK